MIKASALSVVLLLMVCIMAAVTAFGFDDEASREFGRDIFDRKYQKWLVGKRALGQASPWASFGQPVGDHHRYFNWKDYFANAIHNHKRQLTFGPRSFGNYRSYFTDGLQDWKNTFRGISNGKRGVLLDEDGVDAMI